MNKLDSLPLNVLTAILTNDVSLVDVEFEKDGKVYTYKVPNSWEVQEGDTLVVKAPYSPIESKFTAVYVIAVKDMSNFDETATFSYKWAVDIVDSNAYEVRLQREADFEASIKAAKVANRRRKALEELNDNLTSDEARLVQEAVNRLNGTPWAPAAAPQSPPAPQAYAQPAPPAPPAAPRQQPMPAQPRNTNNDFGNDEDTW